MVWLPETPDRLLPRVSKLFTVHQSDTDSSLYTVPLVIGPIVARHTPPDSDMGLEPRCDPGLPPHPYARDP